MLGSPPFRTIKLRSKKSSCLACSGPIEATTLMDDYVQFCGGPQPDWVTAGLHKGNTNHRVDVAVRTLF